MAFFDFINKPVEDIGGTFGLTPNASRNAFLGGLIGGIPGIAAGAAAGPVANFFSGADAANAANSAKNEAERTRRKAIVSQMNLKSQADSLALAGFKQNTGGNSGSNNNAPGGFIGSNLNTTSGTF